MCNRQKYGTHIGYSGKTEQIICDNWPSSLQHYDKVTHFIKQNVAIGRIEGPLQELHPGYRASPLGAILKRNSSDKIRVIHDLSHPPGGKSVNDGITAEECTMTYVSVMDAVRVLEKYRDPWMFKTDMREAFLSVMVHPDDRHLLGFTWQENGNMCYYQMCVLSFGLSSSPKLFDEQAKAIDFMCKSRGATQDLVRYLDDILGITGCRDSCQKSLDIVVETCTKSGFPIQHEKTVGPTQCIEFLGIIIDVVKRELRISEERMSEILTELDQWSGGARLNSSVS